ncbi:MAG TPA: PAS domain S-box protein [Candidatus Acidoferrum sp.]|nr:PAS domain S-box protein [Candidatus Acidoferrum sp.]
MTRAELIAHLQTLESKPAEGDGPAAQRSPSPGLRDTEERLRAILQTAVEGIITIDEHGIVESMNPAAERLFGFSAGEVIGRNVSVLMPSPYRQEHDTYMANYLRTGKARIIGIGREVVGQRKDGTTFPMDLAVSEVRLADRRLFTGFVRDISESKRLERELLEISDQERRRIGQDLHDGLCQHLAGIELKSQVLAQKLGARSKAAAGRAAEIARHVREAIGQTRSLARGLSPVTLESEGLASALHELADNAEGMFTLACAVECVGPILITAPATLTHLYRIAQEAVSNAVKHGKASRVLIRLESSPARTILRVTDDGRGFPEPAPRSKGMGLRIMRYRAGMIGGVLSIDRNPAGGTTVTCSVANP